MIDLSRPMFSIAKQAAPAFGLILKKFNPQEPRDKNGRWIHSGGAGAHVAYVPKIAAKLLDDYPGRYTESQVLAGFSNTDRHHLAHAIQTVEEELQAGMGTDKQFKKDGVYTPERKKIHREILQEILSPEAVKNAYAEHPTVYILGGRGGSGKSQFDKEVNADAGVYDKHKAIVIDPDRIKELLGEKGSVPYTGQNAALFHEESSYLAALVQREAKRKHLNIVLDITMKSDKTKEVKAFKKSGYRVEGHYMFLPAPEAAKRAVGRWKTKKGDYSGRLVPPKVILANTENEKNFDKLTGLFDNWSVYRNDVKEGEPPRLVARKET